MKKPYKQPKSATMKTVQPGTVHSSKSVSRGPTETSKAKPDTSSSKLSGHKRANHGSPMTKIPEGM